MDKNPWEVPLRHYVGQAHVWSHIRCDGSEAAKAFPSPSEIRNNCRQIMVLERPDLEFWLSEDKRIWAIDVKTGELAGGMTPSFPYVFPGYRGRNINAEINILRDHMGMRRIAVAYTDSGFGSRVATHRLHVERALRAGHPVPQEVLEDYQIANGTVALRHPYTAAEHNAWSKRQAAEIREQIHAKRTQGYLAVFPAPDEENHSDFPGSFNPTSMGMRSRLPCTGRPGSGFLIHHQNGCCTVQAEYEDMVIDSDGIRPSSAAEEDLISRSILDPDTPNDPVAQIQTFRVESEEELLCWMAPTEFGSPSANLSAIPRPSLPEFREAHVAQALESLPGSRALTAIKELTENELSLSL